MKVIACTTSENGESYALVELADARFAVTRNGNEIVAGPFAIHEINSAVATLMRLSGRHEIFPGSTSDSE